MWNKAALFLPLLLLPLASCGDGGGGNGAGTKAGFDRYERSVSDLLAREERLRHESAQALEEALLRNRFDDLEVRVRTVLLPAYEEMRDRASRVRPAGGDLSEIHGELVSYFARRVSLYREYLEFAARAAGPAAKLDAKMAEVVRAGDGVEGAVARISVLANADEEVAALARDLFARDPVMNGRLLETVPALGQGAVEPRPFLAFLSEKVEPWYAELSERLSAVEGDGPVAQLVTAARAYVAAARELVRAMRERALLEEELSPYVESEVKPRIGRFTKGMEETERDLAAFRQRARAYRASLRE